MRKGEDSMREGRDSTSLRTSILVGPGGGVYIPTQFTMKWLIFWQKSLVNKFLILNFYYDFPSDSEFGLKIFWINSPSILDI